jgi:hypothetical protein
MYVRNSVRPYGMKSVSHFFFIFYFFSQYVRKSVSMYGTRMSRMDRQVSVIFLVSMYECHGWTDKFQLFPVQFQFSRIQSNNLSVRTEVPTKKKKKKKNGVGQKTQTEQIRSEVAIKRDRWHNSRAKYHELLVRVGVSIALQHIQFSDSPFWVYVD